MKSFTEVGRDAIVFFLRMYVESVHELNDFLKMYVESVHELNVCVFITFVRLALQVSGGLLRVLIIESVLKLDMVDAGDITSEGISLWGFLDGVSGATFTFFRFFVTGDCGGLGSSTPSSSELSSG